MSLKPYLDDGDVRLYNGDALAVLRALPAESVQMCVTSPPYFGLRDYGTGDWQGGDPDCRHRVGGQVEDNKAKGAIVAGVRPGVDASRCLDCGARRIDQQVGLESRPADYVARMVEIFREVRRVLRTDGTLWLNLGDSYNAGRSGGWPGGKEGFNEGRNLDEIYQGRSGANVEGLKPKDLIGIPWRVAFALQDDGWYLRMDNIWAKPNPMPESVADRPTKAHEYVFLFSKAYNYYYDQDAVREPYSTGSPYPGKLERMAPPQVETLDGSAGESPRGADGRRKTVVKGQDGSIQHRDGERWPHEGRNMRSVWEINTQAYPEAHFAVFPEELPRRCILAGSRPNDVVLDPFAGSGTTGVVARAHARRALLIELSQDYCELAAKRLQQLSLFSA